MMSFIFSFYVKCGVIALLFAHNAGSTSTLLNLTITTDLISIPVATDYVGLSMEWGNCEFIMGNSIFTNLMNHLRLQFRTEVLRNVNVRIGGNSADETWWDPYRTRDRALSCQYSYSGDFCIKDSMTPELLYAVNKGTYLMMPI